MSYFAERQNALDLENAKNFIKPIQRLEFFIRNVPLQSFTLNKLAIWTDVGRQVHKSFSEHQTKATKLWIEFVQRINNQYLGITPVHLQLLEILIKNYQYKLALKIVEHPGLPINISINKYQNYLILCAEVYNEFQKYKQAFECLNLANSFENDNFRTSFKVLKLLVLNSKILCYKYDKLDFQRDVTKIKNLCQRQLVEIDQTSPIEIRDLATEYQIFSSICEDKSLQQVQINYPKIKNYLELYQKIPSKAIKDLKQYIKRQIADSTKYRIKATQIQQQPISNFQIIRNVNKARLIYKYDSKNKIMYFQHHQQGDQNQLDQMINKACIMQNIIKNRPAESKVQESDRSDRIGGFGGLMGSLFGMGRR